MPLGMCLDAAPTTGDPVTFQPCVQPDRQPRQQWSLNDSSNFQGTTDGVTLNSLCFAPDAGTFGSFVGLGAGGNGIVRAGGGGRRRSRRRGLRPARELQPVRPVPGRHRVLELDTYGYLIAWPCKQAPSPSQVG